jgi:multidrug resistance efflux pump
MLFLAWAVLISCTKADPNALVLSGTIEAETVRAGSRIGGRVAEALVEEGENVKAADVLFRLETDVLKAERERIEAMVREAEAAYEVVAAGAKPEDISRARNEAEALRQAYELAQAGPLPEEIAAARDQAAALEANWRNAQDAADRMAALFSEGAVSEREYVGTQEAAGAARSQWESALQQLDALLGRPRPEEVAAARSRYRAALNAVGSIESGATKEQLASALSHVEAARQALARIDVDIAEATVVAPLDGVVSGFDLKPGDFVSPGQAACEIADMQKLKVVVYIPENRLGFIREGEELPVRVDAFPDEVFIGAVKRVAAEAEFTPRNVQVVEERVAQVFAVEISLANPGGRLRPGMAADVTVRLDL